MRRVPARVGRTIAAVHGRRGERWLAHLDETLDRAGTLFRCRVGRILPGLSYNLLFEARGHDGRDLLLKPGVPSAELAREIRARRLCGAGGAVRIVRSNARMGALLLERLRPGAALAHLGDAEASLRAFEHAYSRLRRPPPLRGRLPQMQQWGSGLGRMIQAAQAGSASLPLSPAQETAALFHRLVSTTEQDELLHGDLHQGNIIRGAQGWTAIDPKGIVGDRCYDTACYPINGLE